MDRSIYEYCDLTDAEILEREEMLAELGTFAVSSTGKRPLSISQFEVVVEVHCRVLSSRK